jgi:hypothetical protein
MPSVHPIVVPAIAVIGLLSVGAIALLRPATAPSSTAREERAALPAAALQAAGTSEPTSHAASDTSVDGTVAERIAVDKYTYLRLDREGADDAWVAVPTADVRVGDRVTVRNTQLMTSFKSPTLKRTFDAIYFGVLDPPSGAAPQTGGSGFVHPPTAGGSPHADLPSGSAQADSPEVQQAHSAPFQGATDVKVGKVRKAEGALGRRVAEIHKERSALSGKLVRVRVRGVVVKSVPGVLGKTFVHVRDGSGDNDTTRDLTLTTDDYPAIGAQVLFEGTVTVDKDFGSGYRYGVLVENAKPIEDK